jgi:hypothetical protein
MRHPVARLVKKTHGIGLATLLVLVAGCQHSAKETACDSCGDDTKCAMPKSGHSQTSSALTPAKSVVVMDSTSDSVSLKPASKPNLVPPTIDPLCENGFTPIFNGKDIDDWEYGTANNEMKIGVGYRVNPEEKTVYCGVHDGGNLYTKKEYSNFILRFDYKLTVNANNGIGIRAPLAGDSAYAGMEIQVLDDYGPEYRDLRPVQYCGSVYDVFAAETGFLKPVGEWNSEEIMADGMHVRIVLNDHVINDVMLDTMKNPAVLKRHPGLFNKSGHIGFLGHGAAVTFRNLRIKELPDTTATETKP